MNASEGIFFKRFDGVVRKIFFEDKEKYMVLSWIIFRTNYQEEYQGLKRNECYFSYSIVENECSINNRKRLQKILLDLEKDGFIAWIYKSKAKGKKSVIYLIESEHGSEYGLKYGGEYSLDAENKGIEANKDTVLSTVKDTVVSTSSRNISNIYSHIFDYWNSKKIIVHKSLNKDIEKAMENALKKYSEEEIALAIETYDGILKDEGYYFDYKWGLKDFLSRSNGISTFMNEGSNKVNYEEHKKKNTQIKKVVNYDSYID